MAKSKSGLLRSNRQAPLDTQTYFRSSCARRHNLRHLSYLLWRGKRKRTENSYGYRMDFRRSRNFLDYRYYLCDNLRQGHRFGLTADLKSLETGRAKALPVFLKSFVFKMRAFFGHFIFSVLPRRLSQLHFSPIEISVHIVEKKGGKTSDDRYAAQIRFCGERP